MTTSGFYLNDLTYAPNWVIAPGYELLRSAKDSYTYPVEGWYWFDSVNEAALFFGVEVPDDFNNGAVFTPGDVPNWDRLYDQLIVSDIYNYVMQQSAQAQYAGIAGVMTAFAASIIVGKIEPTNPARLEAFQASVYGVLGTASALQIPISLEQLAEVRAILDDNGFNDIQLGG